MSQTSRSSNSQKSRPVGKPSGQELEPDRNEADVLAGWGELMGLGRTDFDLTAGLVQVERAVSLVGARQLIKKPKTPAGVRIIALPMWLLPDLEQHFADYSELTPDGRVFVGPSGITPAKLLTDLGSDTDQGRHERNPLPRPAARR